MDVQQTQLASTERDVVLSGLAQAAAQILCANSFHLEFLDADHSFKRVREDIQCYAPLVSRMGGICAAMIAKGASQMQEGRRSLAQVVDCEPSTESVTA